MFFLLEPECFTFICTESRFSHAHTHCSAYLRYKSIAISLLLVMLSVLIYSLLELSDFSVMN